MFFEWFVSEYVRWEYGHESGCAKISMIDVTDGWHVVKTMWKQMECKFESRIFQCKILGLLWDARCGVGKCCRSFYVRCGFILCEMRCWKMLSIDIISLPIFIVLPRISEFFRPCDPKNCLIQYLSRGLPVFVFQWLGALDKVLHFAEIQMVVETH